MTEPHLPQNSFRLSLSAKTQSRRDSQRLCVPSRLCVFALLPVSLFFVAGCGDDDPPDPDSKSAEVKPAEVKPDPNPGATPLITKGGTTTPPDISDTIPVSPADGGTDLSSQFPALAALPEVPVPRDNPITPAKVALGKLLFFDNRLSGDAGTSCASCHDPRLGWGDGQGVSRGYAGTQHWRNSQTTINSGYLTKLFWAGEVPSLETQAKSAITGNLAGNGDTVMIEERLAQMPEYVRQFNEAFGADYPTFDLALKAIASFERAEMTVRDTAFDQFLNGDEDALPDDAKLGLALFKGKAGCIQCHNGALMSDENYHVLDVPPSDVFNSDPLRQVALRYQHYIRGVPEDVYRTADTDLGLYYTTKKDSDRGRFRTPPLRYLEFTAPYMHNGSLLTIEDVVDFYNLGGGKDENQSPLIKPLNLTEDEKFALTEFLYSLSGDEIRIAVPELPQYKVAPDVAAAD
jgi:cytochrome c peroxidase